MTDHDNDDYAEWLKHRRSVMPDVSLTDRIMSEFGDSRSSPLSTSSSAPSTRGINRFGPALLLTAATLFFAAKITAVVGNLVFPTESFPEFANEQKIEEPANDHGNVSRS